VVLVFRDVTERKRLEDELSRRSQAPAGRDRRKDECLATPAHELRTTTAPTRNSLHALRLKLADDTEYDSAAGMIARRVGSKVALIAGAGSAASAFAYATLAHRHPYDMLITVTLLGIGIGLAFAALGNLIVQAVPPTQTGVASGIVPPDGGTSAGPERTARSNVAGKAEIEVWGTAALAGAVRS